MRRFAITGPESSGKTTLAKALSEHFNAVWIPEYARTYLLDRNGVYSENDLDRIAKGQIEEWSHFSKEELLFCDTEMLVMKIWSEYKYDRCSEFIQDAFREQVFDHYFLCSPDIAWEEDPLREHPEEREALFECYLKTLNDYNLPYSIVKGDLDERVALCINEIKKNNG
jgi:NadR type nicotinamide-nucleotide adenylyltransferase